MSKYKSFYLIINVFKRYSFIKKILGKIIFTSANFHFFFSICYTSVYAEKLFVIFF